MHLKEQSNEMLFSNMSTLSKLIAFTYCCYYFSWKKFLPDENDQSSIEKSPLGKKPFFLEKKKIAVESPETEKLSDNDL